MIVHQQRQPLKWIGSTHPWEAFSCSNYLIVIDDPPSLNFRGIVHVSPADHLPYLSKRYRATRGPPLPPSMYSVRYQVRYPWRLVPTNTINGTSAWEEDTYFVAVSPYPESISVPGTIGLWSEVGFPMIATCTFTSIDWKFALYPILKNIGTHKSHRRKKILCHFPNQKTNNIWIIWRAGFAC